MKNQGRPPGSYLDPYCPIDWTHPSNYSLIAEYSVIPNSGWRGGLTLRDLARGAKRSHDATLTNGPTWNGRIGGRGNVDYGTLRMTAASSQYAVTASDPMFDAGATVFSFAFVIEPVSLAAATFTYLFGNSDDPNTNRGFQVILDQRGGLVGGLGVTVDTAAGVQPFQDGTVNNALDTTTGPHHWYLSYAADGLTPKVWKDGVAQTVTPAVGNGTGNYQPRNTGFALGTVADTVGSGHMFDGYLYNCWSFSKVLTPQDIMAHYLEVQTGNAERWRWINNKIYSFPTNGPLVPINVAHITTNRGLVF